MEIDTYLSQKHHTRKKRRRYFYFVAAFAICYLLFFTAAWCLFRSPLFRVSEITIQGNVTVPADDVVALLQSRALYDHNFWKSLLGFRNMLLWPSALDADDLVFVPPLASVTITKNYWSHTITVTVIERKPLAIWCASRENADANETCYWFDENGVLFKKAFDTEGSLLFAVHDHSQHDRGLNKKILPDQFVANFMSIINVMQESGIGIKGVTLEDIELQEINVTTYDGPDLYFSLRFPADAARAVLDDLSAKPGFAKLQYIDFRVENRAYYK